MKDIFKSFDMFGAPMPSLHIRGEPVVKTSAGACISIIVIGLTSLFALIKFFSDSSDLFTYLPMCT